MFSSICDVLAWVAEDAVLPDKRVEADHLLERISTFDFAFALALMTEVLSITNTLSVALQKKDQDFVNACALINSAKFEIQSFRNDGFSGILQKSVSLAALNSIETPPLEAPWKPFGRRTRGRPPQSRELSHQEYCRFEVLIPVLDRLCSELNSQFNEPMSELMDLASCLQPNDGFLRFNSQKILQLAGIYADEFSDIDKMGLEAELRSFMSTATFHPNLRDGVKSISDLL